MQGKQKTQFPSGIVKIKQKTTNKEKPKQGKKKK